MALVSNEAPALDLKRHDLPNGLRLVTLRNPGSRTVAVEAFVNAGMRFEPVEKAGLAELTGDLLDEGTAARTSLEIAEAVESTGGTLSTSATGAAVSGLAADLPALMEVLSDVLLHPAFRPDDVERKRAETVANVATRLDDPQTVAGDAFAEMVYGAHPYGRPAIGNEKSVKAITADDVKEHWSRFFRPNNAVLAVAGDIDPEAVRALVEQRFGSWRRREVLFPKYPAAETARGRSKREIPRDKEQLHIFLGHLGVRRADPDYYALLVMDYVFGTGPGFTDRLSRTLRDEMGLAYTVYGSSTRGASEEPGAFTTYIGTEPSNLRAAVGGILRQIQAIREKPVTADELQGAKDYLTGSFVFNFETNAQLADHVVFLTRYSLPDDYIRRYPKLIAAVTAADVLRVAREHLSLDRLSLVVCGRVKEAGEGK